MEIQRKSLEAFREKLPRLLKKSVPWKVGRGGIYELRFVSLQTEEPDEIQCIRSKKPLYFRIKLEGKLSSATQETTQETDITLVIELPAFTSRFTFYFGEDELLEYVLISQIRPKPLTTLAKEIKKFEKSKNKDRTSKKVEELIEKFVQKGNTSSSEEEIQQEVNKIIKDIGNLSNYDIILPGKLLEEALNFAIEKIKVLLGKINAPNLTIASSYLQSIVPLQFTYHFERYLRNSSLLRPLDKTNPLSEVSQKRGVTFTGIKGIRDIHGKKIEREIHPSHKGFFCPIETPESERIGLNLHFALGSSTNDGENINPSKEEILGISASLIPFIAHDDMNRASMGARYMKQALPLLKREPPLIKTGYEEKVGKESGLCIIAKKNGEIISMDEDKIVVKYDGEDKPSSYELIPIGGVLPGTGSFYRINEDLALIAESDGMIEKIGDKIIEIRKENFVIKKNIPEGFKVAVRKGEKVRKGSVLAFKEGISKGEVLADASATLKGELCLGVNLLVAYMPWYGYNFEDAIVVSERASELLTSLHLVEGENGYEIVEKKLQVGDKLANRHGNKGVVSLILPNDEMPQLEDGTKIDVLLNPLGVLSRMNPGQLLETHWGWVAKKIDRSLTFSPFTDSFNLNAKSLQDWLKETGLAEGKGIVKWKDREGNEHSAEVVVGYQYILKLNHLAEEKYSYRSTGKKLSITLQPPAGKAYEGGQKVGEMEVWALQAYDVPYILEELLTFRSDTKYLNGKPRIPESFKAFVMYLRALLMDIVFVMKENGATKEYRIEDFENKQFEPNKLSKLKIVRLPENPPVNWEIIKNTGFFDEEDSSDRKTMGYIEFKGNRKPNWKGHNLNYIPVVPPAYRPFISIKGRKFGLTSKYERVLMGEKGAVSGLFNFLVSEISGKTGLIRGYLLGKRIDWSGRAVIVPCPDLQFGKFRLPKDAQRKIENWQNQVFLLNRAPTLHRYNIQAFQPDESANWAEWVIGIHPLICGAYNADFDGDTMAFYHLINEKAKEEAIKKMTPFSNFFSSADGNLLLHLTQDIVLGWYIFTKKEKGREELKKLLDKDFAEPITKANLRDAVADWLKGAILDRKSREKIASVLDKITQIGFKMATEKPPSFSIFDIPELDSQVIEAFIKSKKNISVNLEGLREDLLDFCGEEIWKILKGLETEGNPVAIIAISGARGDKSQLARVGGAVIPLNCKPNSYKKGLTREEYFSAAKYAREEIMDKKLGPPKTGYLYRKLIYCTYDVYIVDEDCGDGEGVKIPIVFCENIVGRVLAKEVADLEAGRIIEERDLEKIRNASCDFISIRSPITCKSEGGICQKCYGRDLANPSGEFPPKGYPAGIVAAQSIGERGTQEVMRRFHGTSNKLNFEVAEEFFKGTKKGHGDIFDYLKKLWEVYGGSVDLKHFEVVFRQIMRKVDNQVEFKSLLRINRERKDESFLAGALFDSSHNVLWEASAGEKEDDLRFPAARLLLPFYDILTREVKV